MFEIPKLNPSQSLLQLIDFAPNPEYVFHPGEIIHVKPGDPPSCDAALRPADDFTERMFRIIDGRAKSPVLDYRTSNARPAHVSHHSYVPPSERRSTTFLDDDDDDDKEIFLRRSLRDVRRRSWGRGTKRRQPAYSPGVPRRGTFPMMMMRKYF